MFVYELKNRQTKCSYIGTSEEYPEVDKLNLPYAVSRDLKHFKFSLRVICELKNREKAEQKAKYLAERQGSSYNKNRFSSWVFS